MIYKENTVFLVLCGSTGITGTQGNKWGNMGIFESIYWLCSPAFELSWAYKSTHASYVDRRTVQKCNLSP